MNKMLKPAILLAVIISCLFSFAQVGINNDNSIPDPSAMLDVKSTDKGLLVPRMDSAQRVIITSPATGLLVYQTDGADGFYFYNGTVWVSLNGNTNNTSDAITDADNNTKIQVEKTPNDDIIHFEMAGTEFFRMDSGRMEVLNTGNSIFIGEGSGSNDDMTDNRNVAVGNFSLYSNTEGIYNTATGYRALYSNTTGDINTATGYDALHFNTTGQRNTAMGFESMYLNTTGYKNTVIGSESMYFNTTGYRNTALGSSSLFGNSTGFDNTAIGFTSLSNNKTGYSNTASGAWSLSDNTTGIENTAIGNGSLNNNTTGSENVAIGYSSHSSNYSGNQNTVIGYKAGGSVVQLSNNGSGNVFLGYSAGFDEVGDNKLYIENSSADSANALIYGEFNNNLLAINGKLGIQTQSPEVPIHITGGTDASLSGGGHIINGATSGVNLVFDNNEIMARNNGAISSIYIQNDGGDLVIHNGKADEKEKFIVKNDGKTGVGETAPSDKLHINSAAGGHAFRVQVDGATKFRIYDNGGVSVGLNTTATYALVLANNSTPLNGQARAYAWTTYSDARIKSKQQPLTYGLKEVLQLQPKSYLHHSSEYNEDGTFKLKGEQTMQTIGFIAQEVQQIIPEVVYQPEDESRDIWSMDYEKLVPVLTKAIQEQQEMIETLRNENNQIKAENAKTKSEIAKIKSFLEIRASLK